MHAMLADAHQGGIVVVTGRPAFGAQRGRLSRALAPNDQNVLGAGQLVALPAGVPTDHWHPGEGGSGRWTGSG